MTAAATAAPSRRMGGFERNLTWWVLGCIAAGIAAGQLVPDVLPGRGAPRGGRGQPAGRGAHLADDRADAAEGGLRRAARGEEAVAGHRRDAVHQLGGQAVLDGAARVGVRPPRLRPLAAGRPARQLRRRPDPARRRALHGDGVRVEQPRGRRRQLHADAGGAQRHDHAVRVRAARRPAAGHFGDHGAVGDARDVRRALHPRARRRRPAVAAKPAARRRHVGARRRPGAPAPGVAFGAAAHTGAAVRLPGAADPRPAADHRDPGRADPDPGLRELDASPTGSTGALASRTAWRARRR